MLSPCSHPRAAANLEEEEEEEVAVMVTVDPLLGAGKVPGRGRCRAGLKARREAQGPKTGAQPRVPVRGAPLPPHVPLLLLAPSRSSLWLERAGKRILSTPPCPAQMKTKSNLPLSMFSS